MCVSFVMLAAVQQVKHVAYTSFWFYWFIASCVLEKTRKRRPKLFFVIWHLQRNIWKNVHWHVCRDMLMLYQFA